MKIHWLPEYENVKKLKCGIKPPQHIPYCTYDKSLVTCKNCKRKVK